MRVTNRGAIPARWTDESTAIVLDQWTEGCPDQRFADEIKLRTRSAIIAARR
jgi:hypothetical protein